jgi:hypothetical protein
MPRTKICGFAAMEINFKAGRGLNRSHMGLMSKVNARRPGRSKAIDIVTVYKTADSAAGRNLKGFPCTRVGDSAPLLIEAWLSYRNRRDLQKLANCNENHAV